MYFTPLNCLAARRTLSLFVAWLLLVNGLLFGFMHAPVAFAAEPAGIETGVDGPRNYVPLIICTANGIKTISVPAELAENGARRRTVRTPLTVSSVPVADWAIMWSACRSNRNCRSFTLSNFPTRSQPFISPHACMISARLQHPRVPRPGSSDHGFHFCACRPFTPLLRPTPIAYVTGNLRVPADTGAFPDDFPGP